MELVMKLTMKSNTICSTKLLYELQVEMRTFE